MEEYHGVSEKDPVSVYASSNGRLGGDLDLDGFGHLSLCAISCGIKYPFFASEEFKKDAEMFNKAGYGFKGIRIKEPDTEYFIEPVYKINLPAWYKLKANAAWTKSEFGPRANACSPSAIAFSYCLLVK